MSRLLVNVRRGAPPPATRSFAAVQAFHRRIAGYAPTELREMPAVAAYAGVGRLLVKAETERFGLPAFKALGASWATYRVLVDRLGGDEPEWSTLPELGRIVRTALGGLRLVTATDGNHGRAVAWMARELGFRATIFVPDGTVPARIEGIESEGADVIVVANGTYDDAVRTAAEMMSDTNIVVSDTSWSGYEDPPRWVIEGYSTIFAELADQLANGPHVDVVVIPLGVGAFGAAAAVGIPEPVRVVGVEPDSAACVLAAVEAGKVVEVPGPHESIMAGLNCGTASMLALPAVAARFDTFVTISDDDCRAAMRVMAEAGLDVGECGAAGVAALAAHARLVASDATALVIATEGVTDPANFEAIVGRRPR